jgi:hypothetical protein
MVALLLIGFVGAVFVLYAAERLLKARRRVHRLRRMSDRLDAAARRGEQQHEQREAAAEASAALTAFIPAIKSPGVTVPGTDQRIGVAPKADPEHASRPDRGRPGRRGPRTGEQRVRNGDRVHTGEQRVHTGEHGVKSRAH